MKIRSLSSVEKTPMDMDGVKDVMKQLPIGSKEGSPNFSFRVFTLAPLGHTPYHQHLSEHVNYIISGQGVLLDKDSKESPVKQGDFCLVLPNEKHQYRNTSQTDDLVMICAVMKEYE